MKRAAFDRDRTAGAAVLRRVDEPTAKEPSQSPQTQPANANKVVEGAPKAAEAHNPLISSQHAQPSAGKCFTSRFSLIPTLITRH